MHRLVDTIFHTGITIGTGQLLFPEHFRSPHSIYNNIMHIYKYIVFYIRIYFPQHECALRAAPCFSG
jgi:hypothetical protein